MYQLAAKLLALTITLVSAQTPDAPISSVTCLPGTFLHKSLAGCEPVLAGYFTPIANLTAPFTCGTGTNGSLPDRTGCLCTDGFANFTSDANATSGSCSACPSGTFGSIAADGTQICSTCAPGTWAVNGSATCSSCPSGTVSIAGQGVCSSCPAKTFSIDGVQCLRCADGTDKGMGSYCTCINPLYAFQIINTTTEQVGVCRCPDGYIKNGTICSACLAGSFTNTDQTGCLACPKGQFCIGSPYVNQQCGAGTIGSTSPVGSASCACDSGFDRWQTNGNCSACLPGHTSNGTLCLPCPAGSVVKDGLCLACPAGSTSIDSVSGCFACPSGTFASAQGRNSCSACPTNALYDVGSIGRTSCSCADGQCLDPVANSCFPCGNSTSTSSASSDVSSATTTPCVLCAASASAAAAALASAASTTTTDSSSTTSTQAPIVPIATPAPVATDPAPIAPVVPVATPAPVVPVPTPAPVVPVVPIVPVVAVVSTPTPVAQAQNSVTRDVSNIYLTVFAGLFVNLVWLLS